MRVSAVELELYRIARDLTELPHDRADAYQAARDHIRALHSSVADGDVVTAWRRYAQIAMRIRRKSAYTASSPALEAVLGSLRASLPVDDYRLALSLGVADDTDKSVGYEVDRGRIIAGMLIAHCDTHVITKIVLAWNEVISKNGDVAAAETAALNRLNMFVAGGHLEQCERDDLVDDTLSELFAALASRNMTDTYFFDMTRRELHDANRRAVVERWGVGAVRRLGAPFVRRNVVIVKGPACLAHLNGMFRAGPVEDVTLETLKFAAQLWDPAARGALNSAERCLETAQMITDTQPVTTSAAI